MDIYLLIVILSAFAWAGKRMSRRENSFVNFLKLIGEFIAFPVIVVYEEFKDANN